MIIVASTYPIVITVSATIISISGLVSFRCAGALGV